MNLAQLDDCERHTREALSSWGFSPAALANDLARAEGADGRFRLDAESWRCRDAEARLVRIRGGATGVFNCLIFPDRPDAVPVFVAELLATGGALRLAFVDLQVPGTGEPQKGAVARRARELARRYGGLNTDEAAPAWAVEFSADRAAYVRPKPPEEVVVTDLYVNYLAAWAESAGPAPEGDPGESRAALDLFKRHHRDEAPVAGYLSRVFGGGWAARFLDGFLYQ